MEIIFQNQYGKIERTDNPDMFNIFIADKKSLEGFRIMEPFEVEYGVEDLRFMAGHMFRTSPVAYDMTEIDRIFTLMQQPVTLSELIGENEEYVQVSGTNTEGEPHLRHAYIYESKGRICLKTEYHDNDILDALKAFSFPIMGLTREEYRMALLHCGYEPIKIIA